MLKKKEISMYSDLSSDNLNKRHEEFTAKYGISFHDTSLSIEERRVKNLIAKMYNDPEKQAEEYHAFCKFVLEYLTVELREFSLITYLAMRKRNMFRIMGEQRVFISFCRNILCIPHDYEVTQFEAFNLNSILADCDNRNGKKTGDEYLYYLKNEYTLSFLGKTYCHDDLRELNNIFFFMGTNHYLFRYFDNDYGSELIFAEISRLEIGNDSAFIIEKEFVRTPQFTISTAGRVYNNTMLIRREACKVIQFNKWQKFYGQSKAERKLALQHINSSIREGLKAKALEYYGAKNLSDFLQINDIQNMILGIFFHEIGHHEASSEMNPIQNAFSTNFSGEDNIANAIGEALADWAPVRDKRKGSFAFFLELSKTDIQKATANVYVYMSDNWFVDTDSEENFLCSQSYLLIGLTYLFINSDGSVDFDRIERDGKSIYNFLQERHKILSDKAIDIVHNAIYDLGNRKIIDYKTLEGDLFEYYQYGRYGNSLEEILKYSAYWSKVFVYLQKFSKEGYDNYQKMLSEENNIVQNMILKMADSDNKYNTLRDYIIGRSKEIGVIKILPEIKYKDAVNKACNEMELSKTARKKAQAKFKKIFEGESIDVTIDYYGNPDPFIAVLQEMMIKSGYGDIEKSILIGEFYEPFETTKELKEYIAEELENLRKEIEAGMHHEIIKLSVNNKYSISSLVDELLAEIKFLNGESMASIIKFVEYTEEIENDALMEVFIPIKRGFFDYNTMGAIYRINEDLRPHIFMEQGCIDRLFLEELIEVYF